MLLTRRRPSESSSMRRPPRPTPLTTTLIPAIRLPTTLRALISAASTTTAVPCWSSWKTGMSSSRLRRSSISKQRGAEMSSRLMPPKTGAIALTVRRSRRGPWCQANRKSVHAAELFEEHRLPFHHRHAPPPDRCRPGREPPCRRRRPRRMLRLDRQGEDFAPVLVDGLQTRATPGV